MAKKIKKIKQQVIYTAGEDTYKFYINKETIRIGNGMDAVTAVMEILEALDIDIVCDNPDEFA